MTAFAKVLSKLTGVIGRGGTRKAKCPAHDDKVASLSITDGDDGRVLLHCHAGCEPVAIVSAIGLTLADLFSTKKTPRKILATYDYRTADGEMVYQVCRYDTAPKTFSQRRPDGAGGWTWNIEGTAKIPYRLPELQNVAVAVVVEGEKDADRLWSLGIAATTNAGGATKWTAAETEALKAAGVQRVVILPDNDKPGLQHAEAVVARAKAAGLTANIVVLPDLPVHGGDVSDWLDEGHTKDELLVLINAAPSAPVDAPATLATPPKPSDPESASALPLSQATLLLRLAQETGVECFHDDEQSYLYVPVDDHHETYAIRSRRGRAWLQGLFMDAMDKCPGSQAIADATNALEALSFRGPAHRVHVRIAARADRVYLDLADASWRVIEISATGWRLVCAPPRPIPTPEGLAAAPTAVTRWKSLRPPAVRERGQRRRLRHGRCHARGDATRTGAISPPRRERRARGR